MYTSIIHPDGRELQIKCGMDECQIYKVGDDVGSYVDPDWPGQGYLLDNVYDSYSNHGEDDWVVISGGKVVAIEPKELEYSDIRVKYNIETPKRELWSEEAWAIYEDKNARHDAEWRQALVEADGNPLLAHLALRSKHRINYSTIAHEITTVTPMTIDVSLK